MSDKSSTSGASISTVTAPKVDSVPATAGEVAGVAKLGDQALAAIASKRAIDALAAAKAANAPKARPAWLTQAMVDEAASMGQEWDYDTISLRPLPSAGKSQGHLRNKRNDPSAVGYAQQRPAVGVASDPNDDVTGSDLDGIDASEVYPATFKTAKGVVKAFKVRPADRKLFIETVRRMQFDSALFFKTEEGKRVEFESVGVVEGKQFSSKNHGLYGRVSYRIVLPNGTEYELSGQITLTLDKRLA